MDEAKEMLKNSIKSYEIGLHDATNRVKSLQVRIDNEKQAIEHGIKTINDLKKALEVIEQSERINGRF